MGRVEAFVPPCRVEPSSNESERAEGRSITRMRVAPVTRSHRLLLAGSCGASAEHLRRERQRSASEDPPCEGSDGVRLHEARHSLPDGLALSRTL